MAEAMEKVANAFPDTNFAIIDSSQQAMKSQPKNLEGLLFKENEAGYLVGYMAGLYTKDKGGDQVISTVGGQKIPPVDGYIAGFQAGAKAANPDIKTLNAYSQDFVDQAKCKELALNQIAEGSQVVFQVAGACGLGALDAAKEKGVQGIGVDADQAYLGDQIMTSALKKIDEAVFTTVKEVQDGSFKAGTDTIFDAKSNGVGFGKTNAEGAKYKDQVDEQLEKIKAGEIENPDRGQGQLTGHPTPLALELKGVTKRFGALTANDSVDFDLRRGEVHALLGENGAGKSTLMNVLYGLLQPDEGEVHLRGEPVHIGSPREAIGLRIGMVHQHFMLIPVMTVAENVVLASEPRKGAMLDRSRGRAARARAVRPLRPLRRSARLRRGHRRRPAAARGDPARAAPRRRHPDPRRADRGPDRAGDRGAVRRPARADRRGRVGDLHLAQAARGARDRRPRDRAAARQEDRHGPDRGRDRGQPRQADGRPRRALPGREGRRTRRASALLEVEGLEALDDRELPALRGLSLRVRAGEIVGIAGVDGNGQSELVEVITGLRGRAGRPRPRRRRATSPAAACAARSPPASATSPRTATGAGSCSDSRSPRTSRCASTGARR